MSDYWSTEYKAGILDELKTANDANECLSEHLAAANARADTAEADADRLAEAAAYCAKALEKLDEFKPYPACANPFAEVIIMAKRALAAHDALKGGK